MDSSVKRCKDKKAIAFVGETGFAPAQYLRAGMERLMLDFALRPDLVKKLVKIGEEYYIELYRRLIKEGIEIIILGDDYAGKKGTFISPKAFEEYLLPGISRVVKEIKKLGAYCIIHTCGNIWEIIDRLVQTGIDGLGPLQPDAGMDLNLVKEKYGNALCVIGNVSVDHLCRFSPEEIIEETKNLLFKVSDKGGHILSSSNSITSTVKPQNFLVMMETVEKYGKYPINLSLGGGNKCYTNSV